MKKKEKRGKKKKRRKKEKQGKKKKYRQVGKKLPKLGKVRLCKASFVREG